MPQYIVCNSDYSESLAICPKCGFVPDASLVGAVKDEYPKHDPNVPDLKKYWCRECRGHHDTILCGTTDEKTLCKNCRSDDVHLVRLNITKSNFFIGDVNPLALPAASAAVSAVSVPPPTPASIFHQLLLTLLFPFGVTL